LRHLRLLCSPCFWFIQRTHALAVHLVFPVTPYKRVHRHAFERTWGHVIGPSFPVNRTGKFTFKIQGSREISAE
jgi:hypothetical protein